MRAMGWMIGLSVITAALTTMGCDNKIMAPGAGSADLIMMSDYPDIVFLEGLDQYMSYSRDGVVVRRPDTSPMQVIVPVRVRSDKEINIQYRFEFYKETREGGLIPVDPRGQTSWKFMHLPARAQHFLQGGALDRSATHWRLVVRPAR